MLHRLAATKAAARLGTTSQRHQMLPAYPSSAAASQPAQPVPAEKVKILLEPIDLTPENFKPFGQVRCIYCKQHVATYCEPSNARY